MLVHWCCCHTHGVVGNAWLVECAWYGGPKVLGEVYVMFCELAQGKRLFCHSMDPGHHECYLACKNNVNSSLHSI